MQRVLADQGREEETGRETDKLNLALISLVLSRGDFCEVEALGYGDGLSLELYYFCSMILLFLLLSGLLNSALFVYGNGEAADGIVQGFSPLVKSDEMFGICRCGAAGPTLLPVLPHPPFFRMFTARPAYIWTISG